MTVAGLICKSVNPGGLVGNHENAKDVSVSSFSVGKNCFFEVFFLERPFFEPGEFLLRVFSLKQGDIVVMEKVGEICDWLENVRVFRGVR